MLPQLYYNCAEGGAAVLHPTATTTVLVHSGCVRTNKSYAHRPLHQERQRCHLLQKIIILATRTRRHHLMSPMRRTSQRIVLQLLMNQRAHCPIKVVAMTRQPAGQVASGPANIVSVADSARPTTSAATHTDTVVFVNRGSRKFHLENCRHKTPLSDPMNLGCAISKRLEPCKQCFSKKAK